MFYYNLNKDGDLKFCNYYRLKRYIQSSLECRHFLPVQYWMALLGVVGFLSVSTQTHSVLCESPSLMCRIHDHKCNTSARSALRRVSSIQQKVIIAYIPFFQLQPFLEQLCNPLYVWQANLERMCAHRHNAREQRLCTHQCLHY